MRETEDVTHLLSSEREVALAESINLKTEVISIYNGARK
jgi:hypothetical protein